MNELARQASAVNQANLALGCEVFQADGATFVRNRDFPEIRDINHITNVEAESPAEIDRLLARIEIEFGNSRFRAFHLAPSCPPAFEARLGIDGYVRADDQLVMILAGPLMASAKPIRIEPVDDEPGWQAYAGLKRLEFREYMQQEGSDDDPRIADQLTEVTKGKPPPTHHWLAYVDGAARGFFSSYVALQPEFRGMGQVEDLFVHPEFRHRGIATALIEHCVADCRGQGAEQVVIVAAAGDTPKNMYAAMGFRPLTLERRHRKFL